MNTSSSEGGISLPSQPGSPRQGAIAASSAGPIGAADVQGRAEGGHHLHAGLPAQGASHAIDPLPLRPPRDQPRLRQNLLDRALGQQSAVGDVGDAVAALGLVHVVRADQDGHAAFGEAVDLVPELAPGLGVDAGGGLVEQEQLRLVQDGGGQRQALLPAARERPRELALAVGETQPLERFGHPLPTSVHGVEPGDEAEILLDAEILVEAEALGHVADLALDRPRLPDDVVAETGAAAAVGRQQPAQHADGRGLAAAVGAEEAADLAALDLDGEVVDHGARAEALDQAAGIDDRAHRGRTSTGWPGLSVMPAAGQASTMKTSLPRLPTL